MCETRIHLIAHSRANQDSSRIWGRNEQTASERHVEMQRTSFANILLKMDETEGLTQPDFKAYDKSHMNQGRAMVEEQIGKSRNTATQTVN